MQTLINFTDKPIEVAAIETPQDIAISFIIPARSQQNFDDKYSFSNVPTGLVLRQNGVTLRPVWYADYTYATLADAILDLPSSATQDQTIKTVDGFILQIDSLGKIPTLNGKTLSVKSKPDKYRTIDPLIVQARSIIVGYLNSNRPEIPDPGDLTLVFDNKLI